MSFCGELRANTAIDILIGPFVDSTDGVTAETGLTIDVELSKNGQALGNKNDATDPVHDVNGDIDGYYNCELDTTDTNTEGLLAVVCYAAGALPVRHDFMVLSEAAWDSKYVAKDDGFMDVNVKTIGRADTQETEANNLEAACAAYSATRGLSGTALPAAAADAAGGLPISDAGGLDLDVIAGAHGLVSIQDDIDAILADTGELQTNQGNWLTATGFATDAEMAKVPKSDSNVSWNATALAAINAECDTAISDAALATSAEIAALDGVVDTVKVDTAAILADTGTDGVVVASGSKTGYTLHSDYDAAKTAAQASDPMTLDVGAIASTSFAANAIDAAALAADAGTEIAAAVLGGALAAESYCADAGTPTLSQILWMIWAGLVDYSIAGTTLSVKNQAGAAVMTFTLDDDTNPTSRTRAT